MVRYYLITHLRNQSDIGEIILINEPETIDNLLKKEFKVFKPKYTELSLKEYKYYSKIPKHDRIKKYGRGTFNYIMSLQMGYKCQINQYSNDNIVTITKIDESDDGIFLHCTTEDGYDREIDINTIDYLQVLDKEQFKNNETSEKAEFFDKYFFDLLHSTKDLELEIKIIEEILESNNEKLIMLLFQRKNWSLNLAVHRSLLPLFIEKRNVPIIKLLLIECDLTSVPNITFLNIVRLAIKENDDQLFQLAIEHCSNKNVLLENGESLMTNLFKDDCSEEQINKIISKHLFNTELRNKKDESPFFLACKMGMVSVVNKIIPESLLPAEKQRIIRILLLNIDRNNKEIETSRNYRDILKLVNEIRIEQLEQGYEVSIAINGSCSCSDALPESLHGNDRDD